ncbi:anti-sigma factor [Robiginitalea myxolifaciens]|nr:anti-sigma factor [Robiginitalea myxolifaciens]
MDVSKYIASGILELYVAGALSEQENQEVAALAQEYPEILAEVEAIEASIRELAASYASGAAPDFAALESQLTSPSVKQLKPGEPEPRRFRLWAYSGWAAALIIGAASLYLLQERNRMAGELDGLQEENTQLETQISQAREGLENANATLKALGEKGIQLVPLTGQQVAPEAYARAFWNTEANRVYIDANGLPEPPPGMVYQVWSLKLDPLTPTSLGLLEDFAADTDKIFALANPNDSEAFGITLEPAGGSESPTLEQLYTLGAVSS